MTNTSRNIVIIMVASVVVVVAIFAYIYVQNQKSQNTQNGDLFSEAIQQAPTIGDPQQAIQKGIDQQ